MKPFDPYRQWLGIPPEEQPPHLYRLLGIGLFESNADVIEGAADRQMAHVQRHKAGPHAALSQKILNELTTAKLCLLREDRKALYDRDLRKKLAARAASATIAPPPAAPSAEAQPIAAPIATRARHLQSQSPVDSRANLPADSAGLSGQGDSAELRVRNRRRKQSSAKTTKLAAWSAALPRLWCCWG